MKLSTILKKKLKMTKPNANEWVVHIRLGDVLEKIQTFSRGTFYELYKK